MFATALLLFLLSSCWYRSRWEAFALSKAQELSHKEDEDLV
jgi:hypothetical protein